MLNATIQNLEQNTGYKTSGHRHRLPNLHKKLGTSTPEPTPSAPETSGRDAGWFRAMVSISILLAVFAAIAYLIAKFAGDEIARAGHTIERDTKRIIINADIVTIPANMIRYSSQRRLAKARQLDLYLHWPKLQGYSERLKSVFNDTDNNSNIIFATLSPRFSALDMSARINPIYKKFFISAPREIGYGLTSHELDPEAGFIDEYLIVEKNSPHPFSARCIKSTASVATPFCIRDIHIGKGLSLSYRFHANLIPEWLVLERSMRTKFMAMVN